MLGGGRGERGEGEGGYSTIKTHHNQCRVACHIKYGLLCTLRNTSCVVPEIIHTSPPQKVNGNSKGEGGGKKQKFLKKCMELNWNFQRWGCKLEKPSMGEGVWTFCGTTQCYPQKVEN